MNDIDSTEAGLTQLTQTYEKTSVEIHTYESKTTHTVEAGPEGVKTSDTNEEKATDYKAESEKATTTLTNNQ